MGLGDRPHDTRSVSAWLAAGLALGGVALPLAAWGFSAQGPRWPNDAATPVPFMVAPEGSDDVPDAPDVVETAFMNWQDVECSYLTFERQAWTGTTAVANDGVNQVFWVEDGTRWQQEFLGQPDTLALTFVYSTVDNRTILGADMILNGADWQWTADRNAIGSQIPGPVDVGTIVLHEAGHFFGLAHSADPAAAMFQNNNKGIQRVPADDDIRGICALYSNGEPIPGVEPGDAPVGAPCNTGTDCASNLCADDVTLGTRYCTAACVQGQTDACPVGFACESTGDGNAFCLAPLPVDELCDQCSNGSQCSTGICATVANVNNLQPFCTRSCDPNQPSSCPSGYRCEVTQQAVTLLAACVPTSGICDPSGKGGQNELCFANGRCKAGHRCVEYSAGLGLSFCYADCDATQVGQSCGLPRTICAPVSGLMNTAACFTFAQIGQPCIPEVCDPAEAFCAFDEVVGVDSALCYQLCPNGQNDCAPNTQCQSFDGIPSLCVPNDGFKRDGDVCIGDAECESRLCRPFGGASLCTRVCQASDSNGCTPGLRCYVNAGDTSGFCGPQEILNPDDPSRGVGGIDSDFCACDRTVSCEEGCDCDPECEGSASCACVQIDPQTPAWPFAMLIGLPLLVLTARGRNRRRPRGTA